MDCIADSLKLILVDNILFLFTLGWRVRVLVLVMVMLVRLASRLTTPVRSSTCPQLSSCMAAVLWGGTWCSGPSLGVWSYRNVRRDSGQTVSTADRLTVLKKLITSWPPPLWLWQGQVSLLTWNRKLLWCQHRYIISQTSPHQLFWSNGLVVLSGLEVTESWDVKWIWRHICLIYV